MPLDGSIPRRQFQEVGSVGGFIQHGESFDCLMVDENFLIQPVLIPFLSILECYWHVARGADTAVVKAEYLLFSKVI